MKSVGRTPRTPLRDLTRRNFSTTPLREVQDRHQPPSNGKLENVLKTPPSYTFCWTGARGPSYGINPPTLILDGRHYRIDTKRRARSPGWAVPAAGHRGSGGLRTARARRGLSNAHYSTRVHTDLSKSMRRGLAMAPARFGSLWGLGPGALCLVLLAHANTNDILDRAL